MAVIQSPLSMSSTTNGVHSATMLSVDARQRNERNARMGAEEIRLEQVHSRFEFCLFLLEVD
jgi:hypothetical protein